MAKKIKHASKGEIVFLSKGSYEQLHTSILQTLGKNAPFAPVRISPTAVVWENNTRYDFKSIGEAPEDIRGQLMLLFEQQSKTWASALKKQHLEYVLTVPDSSYIFYAVDKNNDDNVLNNKYHFLITGWACSFNKSSDSGSDGLEKDIIEAREKHQYVIVEMIDGKGKPIANSQFIYNFNNSIIKDITTDANGRYEQGICLVGSEYKFQYKLTGQEKTLKVVNGMVRHIHAPQHTVPFRLPLLNQLFKTFALNLFDIEQRLFRRNERGCNLYVHFLAPAGGEAHNSAGMKSFLHEFTFTKLQRIAFGIRCKCSRISKRTVKLHHKIICKIMRNPATVAA